MSNATGLRPLSVRFQRITTTITLAWGLILGCSSNPGNSNASGGSGANANGGAQASGGMGGGTQAGKGGSSGSASGGANAGGSDRGGASAGGGPSGGTTSTGGTTSAGGTSSSGGTNSNGGGTSNGGTTSTGGKSASGGSSSLGGASTSGGTTTSGGNAAKGGSTATGGTSAFGGASSGGANSLLVPTQGALLGSFVGEGTPEQLEGTLGRKLAILHNYFAFSTDWVPSVPADLAKGRVPLVTWETWENGVGVPLDDIIAGKHDTMIRARATAAKNVGQKFFLRWGHEMNGNWYPWDGYHNGANASAAAKYIAAYRHIHDLFVSAGATNVLWVFCPNVDSVPGDAWNQWSNYYPGDAYVDWMGFDGYNWGSAQTWQAFSAIAGRIYPGLATKNKPIMIAETASTEQGGDKASWIAAVVPALKNTYPNIKALVWFHVNKEADWRLDSTPAVKTAAVAMAKDPYFNP
ncbi:MAG: glycoside hydrolase family 26 protein [Myxococcota bacterium]